LAITGVLLALGLSISTLLLQWAVGGGWSWASINNASYVLNGVMLALIALPICLRQSRNPIGWLNLAMGLCLAVQALLDAYVAYAFEIHDGQLPGLYLAALASTWVWAIPYMLLANVLLLFPDGRYLSPRWRWVSAVAIAWLLLLIIGVTFADPILAGDSGQYAIANPIGLWQIPDEVWFRVLFPAILLILSLGIVSLIARWRGADSVLRQQLKYLIVAMILIVVVLITTSWGTAAWLSIISNMAFLAMPAAITLAILRYRLYDIDFILRRTTSYTLLTALLALVYFGSILVLQRFLSPLTGDSNIAVVLSTLLIAALFLPLRRRIQDAIDRRFFRSKYDAEQVLAQFAATVRDETDLDALTAELVRVIQETMQPEFVSVWLRDQEGSQS
jgi:hypothetical protein